MNILLTYNEARRICANALTGGAVRVDWNEIVITFPIVSEELKSESFTERHPHSLSPAEAEIKVIEDTLKKDFGHCALCSAFIPIETLWRVKGGELVCSLCFQTKYSLSKPPV